MVHAVCTMSNGEDAGSVEVANAEAGHREADHGPFVGHFRLWVIAERANRGWMTGVVCGFSGH